MSTDNNSSVRVALPIVTGLAASIALLAIYYFAVHVPRSDEEQQLTAELNELNAEIDGLQESIANRDNAILSLNRLCDLRDERLSALPGVPRRNQIRFAVEEFARRAEVESINSEWGERVNGDSRTRHILQVTGQATHEASLRFIELLGLHDADLAVVGVTIEKPEDVRGGRRTTRPPEAMTSWTLAMYSSSSEQRDGGEWCDLAQNDNAEE